MAIDEGALLQVKRRAAERRDTEPRAIAARYDRRIARVVVSLNTGLELAIPPHMAEGLDRARPDDLAVIEISASGLGLHWPALDADLYLPGLLQGVFGSPKWMAGLLGRAGGRARSPAKTAAARINGRKGGRPRKSA